MFSYDIKRFYGEKSPTRRNSYIIITMTETSILIMGNFPLQYVLYERKATLGSLKNKMVIQAQPTGRKRISHRNFCEEVARATTFTGAEVEAVLRLAAEIAKKHVENGNIVEFGDIGTLKPSFKSKQVEKGVEEFNANVHIVKPTVLLSPSRKYFELRGVSFERVEPKPKKKKNTSSGSASEGSESDPLGPNNKHTGL